MTKLRKSARGQPCLVRIPGVCNHDPETVVLAHVRRGQVAGTGQKPADLCGVFACSSCHNEIDRRTRKVSMDELDGYILDGMCRTLAYWSREGLIRAD